MACRYLSGTTLAIALFTAACHNDPPLDNPLDPEATSYIPPIPPGQGVLIDDYNDGRAPNLLGHCSAVPFKDLLNQADVVVSYDGARENALRGIGFSLRIDYDVSRGDDPFGGYVEPLAGNDVCSSLTGPFDLVALNYRVLSFWVRTESGRPDAELALKDMVENQTTPKRLLREFATPGATWVNVRIQVSELTQGEGGRTVDLRRLKEVNFGFAKKRFTEVGADLRGRIYIDDVAFER